MSTGACSMSICEYFREDNYHCYESVLLDELHMHVIGTDFSNVRRDTITKCVVSHAACFWK